MAVTLSGSGSKLYTQELCTDHQRFRINYSWNSTETSVTFKVRATVYAAAAMSYTHTLKGALVSTGALSKTIGTFSKISNKLKAEGVKELVSTKEYTFTKTSSQQEFHVTLEGEDKYNTSSLSVTTSFGVDETFIIPALTRYTITLKEKTNSSHENTLGTQQKYYGNSFTLSDFSNPSSNVIFEYWANGASSTTKAYARKATYSANANATLYRIFRKFVGISFQSDGKWISSGTYYSPYRNYTEIGSETYTLNLPSVSKTGYTLDGWYFNNTKIGSSKQITTSATTNNVYARWTANTYHIYYNSNYSSISGWSGSEAAQVDQSIVYDQTSTPTINNNTFNPNYGDWVFSHWNTKADGTGTTYSAGAPYTNRPLSNLTLYAIWKYNYQQPSYNKATVYRCDADGENAEEGKYATLNLNLIPAQVGGVDIKTKLTVSYTIGQTNYSHEVVYDPDEVEPISLDVNLLLGKINTGTTENPSYEGGFDINKQYTINLEFAPYNNLNNTRASATTSLTLSNAFYVVDVNTDGTRWAFGKIATDNTGEENFKQGVEFGVPIINGFEVHSDNSNNTIFKVEEIKEDATYSIQYYSDNATATISNFLISDYQMKIAVKFNSQFPNANTTFSYTLDRGTLTGSPLNGYILTQTINIKDDVTTEAVGTGQLINLLTLNETYDGSTLTTYIYTNSYDSRINVMALSSLPPDTQTLSNIITECSVIETPQINKPAIHFGSNPTDLSDSNIVYGVYTDGTERKIFELPNKSDNISIGYGAYQTAPPNSGYTNIYGQRINLRTKEGIYLEGHDEPIGKRHQYTILSQESYTANTWKKFTGTDQRITLSPGSYIVEIQLLMSRLASGANAFMSVGWRENDTSTDTYPNIYMRVARPIDPDHTATTAVIQCVKAVQYTTSTTLTPYIYSNYASNATNAYWSIMRIA